MSVTKTSTKRKASVCYQGSMYCQAELKTRSSCTARVRFLQDGLYLCGRHSKKEKRSRLEKNPDSSMRTLDVFALRRGAVTHEMLMRASKNLRGDLACSKFVFNLFGQTPCRNHFRMVFPTFAHQHFKDGISVTTLAPMTIHVECGAKHRYFYCSDYEKLAHKTADYDKLEEMLSSGVCLEIKGINCYDVGVNATASTLLKCYRDNTKPFDYELALYCMLALKDPSQYPWNVERAENESIYETRPTSCALLMLHHS